jgi:hypothetical protein
MLCEVPKIQPNEGDKSGTGNSQLKKNPFPHQFVLRSGPFLTRSSDGYDHNGGRPFEHFQNLCTIL